MYLSIPATISIACASVNLVFAALSMGIGRRGGWREMRAFSLVALTAAAFNLCNTVVDLPVAPDLVITWASRISIAIAALHGGAWVLYMAADEARGLKPFERAALAAVVVVAVVAVVPGLVISSAIGTHQVAWLGATYRDAQPTVLGGVVFAICVAFLLLPLVHFVRRWRAGAPLAWAFVLGLSLLIASGANDALAGAGVLHTPYLLDLGFLGVVVAAGGSMVHRFVGASRELDALTGRLEQLVEKRTRELTAAQGALARAEKLAAIGGLAAGVAHEINNPAAAVLANLTYLREPLLLGEPLPADVRECLDESVTSVQRIARIVRQLLDAGRVAGGPQGRTKPVALRGAIDAAVADVRASERGVEVTVAVPDDLHVLGDDALLVQVLVNLMQNGAHAIAAGKPGGRITISAERRSDRVLVSVHDEGGGIPLELQPRLFEPFFTTKGPGRGTGLGLAVSLGLMRAQGGDLRLLTTSPAGTTFGVELPWAEARAREERASTSSGPTAVLRLLLVDDDPMVLEALRRKLGGWFSVEAVNTVDGALSLAARTPHYDLALCDVLMPDGGGERLLTELDARGSPLASRTLFMTGGAATPATQAFVEKNKGRVLQKPIDTTELLALASSIERSGHAGDTP